jgi:predicted nucleic acid-binding protein
VRLLLDTSVLIDTLRRRHGRRELLAELVRAGHTLATSSLNFAEVYAGHRPGEEKAIEILLGSLDCYEITKETGRMAGLLRYVWARKGKTLSLADTVIAAVALENNCILMTDNRKDFPMPELQQYPL